MTHGGIYLTVRAVIYRRGGKVLLLQRTSRQNHSSNLWEVPGGKIEAGEPLDVALKREVKEETGLIVYPRHATPVTFISPKEKEVHYVELIFSCKRVRGEKVKLSPEHQSFRWVTVEGALNLELTPITRELMEFLLE